MIDHAYLEKQCVVPSGIAALAAYIRGEYEVLLLDCIVEGYHQWRDRGQMLVEYGLDDASVAARIAAYNPDVIGVSCLFSSQFGAVRRLTKIAKEFNPAIVTVTGGAHPSFLAEKCLQTAPDLDFIVIGEGELTFKDLLDSLRDGKDYRAIDGLAFRENGAVRVNEKTRLIENLDTLPFPARDLLPIEKYFEYAVPMAHNHKSRRNISIATSRGCPFRCTFCSSCNHWRKYRTRSVENVLAEMDELKARWGVEELKFEDDNLTADKKRAKALFQGMIDRGYNFYWNTPNGIAVWTIDDELLDLIKASGAHELTLAIETGDQWVMDNIVKKPLKLEKVIPAVKAIRQRGIDVFAYVIIGFPGETLEQIKRTFELLKKARIYTFAPFLFTPLPGSELYFKCLEMGLIDEDYDFETFNVYYKAPFERPDISQQDLMNMAARAYQWAQVRFFLREPIHFIRRYSYALRSPPRMAAKVINFLRWKFE
jgi:magnesium-protoporphyrin IX monomethyl ester (oxidative) cyclase